MRPTRDALALLYSRAEANLTPDDMDTPSSLTAVASSEALRMASITEKLACLVAEDGQQKGGTGHFQEAEDVFELLCALSQSFEVIGALAEIGDSVPGRCIHGKRVPS